MKIFKIFLPLFLLIAIPLTLLCAQEGMQKAPHSALSYDAIMDLLEELESGELEKRATLEELEQINSFFIQLAREGVLEEEGGEAFCLEQDIEELLAPTYAYAVYRSLSDDYQVVPALFQGWKEYHDFILCKSSSKIAKFVKKYKKAIIIGAIVVVAVVAVVAVAVVTSSAAVAAGAAGAAGASGLGGTSSYEPLEQAPQSFEDSSPERATEAPTLHQALRGEVASFKENLVKEEFFPSTPPSIHDRELSWKENGRALGSLFAHESLKNISEKIAEHPTLAQEVQDLDAEYASAIPRVASEMAFDFGHREMDRKFSTDYACLFTGTDNEMDFTTLSYQSRGEKALEQGYYAQAVHDFDQVIERNPTSSLPYLERSMAHFNLGEYESALEDYHSYIEADLPAKETLSLPEFSLGFAKGLPKGIYDSAEGLFLLASDLITHPVHTGKQMWDALSLLAQLGFSGEWDTLKQVLAPEVYELVREWETIPSSIRGERAGYVFGKYGSDICLPGVIAKASSKGAKVAKELNMIYKTLQTAEKTLFLESIAGLENGARIADVIQAGQKTLALGEELGVSIGEIAQLKKAGTLQQSLNAAFEGITKNPFLHESFLLYERAQDFLKPYTKMLMTEAQARELIHQTGIRTFPRPTGIPENFRITLSDKGAGIIYIHPENTHISVRVMPGKPHSSFPHQQKPYVVHKAHGKTFDKLGEPVSGSAAEAHIPLEEFIYRNK